MLHIMQGVNTPKKQKFTNAYSTTEFVLRVAKMRRQKSQRIPPKSHNIRHKKSEQQAQKLQSKHRFAELHVQCIERFKCASS
ncbi:hypothetical protein G9C98_007580 [Cotesia typhae]|uniref:Uncharacterized protein n=1 Tax=Cotesia typhae TaxID=2053667 RepID=A0A8J5V5N2_9HYME|nr:hypothetical protein G9C98_007580 [Cotesia typhae]